jgi:hypothetical protein
MKYNSETWKLILKKTVINRLVPIDSYQLYHLNYNYYRDFSVYELIPIDSYQLYHLSYNYYRDFNVYELCEFEIPKNNLTE